MEIFECICMNLSHLAASSVLTFLERNNHDNNLQQKNIKMKANPKFSKKKEVIAKRKRSSCTKERKVAKKGIEKRGHSCDGKKISGYKWML